MRWFWLTLRYNDELSEKDKRKQMPDRERWMHTRGYALLIGALFFLTGLVNIFAQPELTPGGIEKQGYMLAIGFTGLILGIAFGVLFALLHMTLDASSISTNSLYLVPTLGDRLLDVVILAAMSIALLLLVRRLQNFRRVFKWAVYLNYLALVVLLLHQATVQPDRFVTQQGVHRQPFTCEFIVSASTRIRAYSELEWLLSADIFESATAALTTYSITRDGGQTWHDFMLGTAPRQSTCTDDARPQIQHFDRFNDQDFWLWQGKSAVFTHDGGKTWTLWQGDRALPGRRDCFIQRITFSGGWQGYMDCQQKISGNPILRTDDGGVTWYLTGG